MANDTYLSSATTVEQFKKFEKDNDRKAISKFVRDRFLERYFQPIEATPRGEKHGFAVMALCCLVIETLESFYQGKATTRRISRAMFKEFFNRDTGLKVFGGGHDWFYTQIRCGILHQSETIGGWRIRREGDLFNKSEKRINATKFMHELRDAVEAYADQLEQDDALFANFKTKMKAVCDNCY